MILDDQMILIKLEVERRKIIDTIIRCEGTGLVYTASFCRQQLKNIEIKIHKLKWEKQLA